MTWRSADEAGTWARRTWISRRAMKTFLLRFFTWWNGQTFGTQLWTARFGAFVG